MTNGQTLFWPSKIYKSNDCLRKVKLILFPSILQQEKPFNYRAKLEKSAGSSFVHHEVSSITKTFVRIFLDEFPYSRHLRHDANKTVGRLVCRKSGIEVINWQFISIIVLENRLKLCRAYLRPPWHRFSSTTASYK